MGADEHLLDLFDELEGRAETLYDADRAPEIADRSRAEYRAVTLASRLMASLGDPVVVRVVGVGPVAGTLERVGDGWFLLRGAAQDWAVPLVAVQSVTGSSARSVPEVAWPRVAALGLAAFLRRLAEEGHPCVLHLRDGGRHEGTLLRVGADFVELQEGADAARRCLVALVALAAAQVRRDDASGHPR